MNSHKLSVGCDQWYSLIMNQGTMTFTSPSAVALSVTELSGQLSDRKGENTAPNDNWHFWCNLKVSVGTTNEVSPPERGCLRPNVRKNSYNFAALYDIVGERMLAA